MRNIFCNYAYNYIFAPKLTQKHLKKCQTLQQK